MRNLFLFFVLSSGLLLNMPTMVKADAGTTLGIVGTALGGAALGMQTINTLGGAFAARSGAYPSSWAVNSDFMQVLSHSDYPSKCPSYPGWYGPYGHVGIPSFTCHNYQPQIVHPPTFGGMQAQGAAGCSSCRR